MIYLYLFGTCFHFIYVFMIIGNYVQSYSLILVEIFCYNIKFLYRYVIKKVGRFKSKTIINIFFCI